MPPPVPMQPPMQAGPPPEVRYVHVKSGGFGGAIGQGFGFGCGCLLLILFVVIVLPLVGINLVGR